jgi:preprotein translocase subunit SecA
LKQKQAAIRKRYPGVKINLHIDMPSPSMNKLVDLAGIINLVNNFESQVSELSDAELRALSLEFKGHIEKKSREYGSAMQELEELLFQATIPED